MDKKQNPFSLYDFLGYFTPGAMLLYAVLLLRSHALGSPRPLADVASQLSFDKAEVYIPFVLVAYTLGHLLSFISSITVEKYSIWAHGYPSKYLLDVKGEGYFSSSKNKVLRFVLRLFVALLLLPVSLLDWLLGHLFHMRALYTKSLDRLLINLIRAKIDALVMEEGEVAVPAEHEKASGADYFRFAYHWAVEKAPNHLPKMQNYVALFGFLRTVTLLSVILFWTLVWHVFATQFDWRLEMMLLMSVALCSFLFYMAFMKFYRRFSLEALMAVATGFKSKKAP